jgi:hypothetical protein
MELTQYTRSRTKQTKRSIWHTLKDTLSDISTIDSARIIVPIIASIYDQISDIIYYQTA